MSYAHTTYDLYIGKCAIEIVPHLPTLKEAEHDKLVDVTESVNRCEGLLTCYPLHDYICLP